MVVGAALISIALRARFLFTPLTSDEGGYLAVARAWGSGKQLYGDVTIDRPQGLMVLFRLWDDLTGGSPAAVRVLAMIFGCVVVIGVAYTVHAMAGPLAAGTAALLVAVTSSAARLEGFTANGELLSGALVALGVAAASAYLFRARSLWWLFASGALAGAALSLKQSGYDGFLAVVACLIAATLTNERSRQRLVRECAVLIAGLASVLSLLVIDGAFRGLRRWWYAIAGYRLESVNGVTHPDWQRLGETAVIAAPVLGPLAIVAVIGAVRWRMQRGRLAGLHLLLPAWLAFATLAFLTGGLFHRHYWVTLTLPLGASAGVAISRWKPRRLVMATCLVALPALISTAQVIVLHRSEVPAVASGDPRSTVDEHIAAWYAEHRTATSTLYAMCASAGLYAAADSNPPFPYLWFDGVLHARGSQQRLVEMFSGDAPPTFVAVYQDPVYCNPSGQVSAFINDRYTVVAEIDGMRILALG